MAKVQKFMNSSSPSEVVDGILDKGIVNPQRTFLRVASLELRKAICERVRDSARQRAEEMDRKIADLEVEEAKLLLPSRVSDPGQPHSTPAAHSARDLRSRERRGLALKY